MTAKPPSADRARAMTILENTGLVMGITMGIAMEQALSGLATQLAQAMSAIGGAVAGALGGTGATAAPKLDALPPALQRDLLKAVTDARTGMKMNTAQRDAAAARLTDDKARAVIAAAGKHLVGLPALDAPLTDEQLAALVAAGLANDPRLSAHMQEIMPIMASITAEPGA